MNWDEKSALVAKLALSLLLKEKADIPLKQDDIDKLDKIDWDLLSAIARKNIIFIRIFDAMRKNNIPFPKRFSNEIENEKQRVYQMTHLVGRIINLCQTNDISFVMPTALLHYPDMGGDIDLLVTNHGKRISDIFKKELKAKPLPHGLLNLLSTEFSYQLGPLSPSIEVHYGRIGLAGEHRFYPTLMVKNRKFIPLDGINVPVLSPEDQLLTQAIYRMYCRFYIRISDLVGSLRLLENIPLNWDYIISIAEKIGISEGLSFYLSYVNKIYSDLFGSSLIPEEVKKVLRSGKKSGLSFKKFYYRYSMFSVTGKIYLSEITSNILSGKLESIVRLCLIPYVALTYFIRNICGRRSRYFG